MRELSEVESLKVSQHTVARYFKRFKTDSDCIADKSNSGRPSTVRKCHFDFIDQKLEEDNELTTTSKSLVSSFGDVFIYLS